MAKQRSELKRWAALSVVELALVGWVAAQGQNGQSLQDKLSHAFGGGGGQPQPCPAQAYDQDATEPTLNKAEMPAKVQDGYKLFRAKCGSCHSLNQQATKSESSPQDWMNMVNRMRDMPSSHMSDAQVAIIVNFVIWNADYSNDLVRTLMAFDRNGDGKLQKDEVPDRFQAIFERADTNHDGVLTSEEIRKYSEAQAGFVATGSSICDPERRLKR